MDTGHLEAAAAAEGGGLAGLRWREGWRVALATAECPELPKGAFQPMITLPFAVVPAPMARIVEAACLGFLPLSELLFSWIKRCFNSCSNQKCC